MQGYVFFIFLNPYPWECNSIMKSGGETREIIQQVKKVKGHQRYFTKTLIIANIIK